MTLEKMEQHLKEQLNSKRRVELEAKLYGYWYPEMNNENLIFEAKSDNEVLAQLNLLEKRLNEQSEKNHNQAQLHDLKMQQELNKLEHIQLDRQQLREQEIREIRTTQETHMSQLKGSHHEIDSLMEKEKKLQSNLEELNKEFELLQKSYDVLKKPTHFEDSANMESIKVHINQRSELFRSQIKMCMCILERTLEFADHPEEIRNLIVLLEAELEIDTNAPSKIDKMNAAEAKTLLQQNEEAWHINHAKCCNKIKDILNNERDSQKSVLDKTTQRQEKLNEIRTNHLVALDNSGEKVKQIIQEDAQYSPHSLHKISTQEEDHKKRMTFPTRHHHHHQQGKESDEFPVDASCKVPLTQRPGEEPNESATKKIMHNVSEESENSPFHPLDGEEEHKSTFVATRRHPHQQGEESTDFPLYSSCNSHEAINVKHAEGRRHPHPQGEESVDFPLYSSCNHHEAIKDGSLLEERHQSKQQGGDESNDSSLNSHRHDDIKNQSHLGERQHSQLQGKESIESSLNSSSIKTETHLKGRHHSQQQGEESNDSSINSHRHEDIKNHIHLDERHHSELQGKESNESSLNSSSIETETHLKGRHHSQQQGEESNDSSINSHRHEDIKNHTHLDERHHSELQGRESNESSLNSSSIKTETHLKGRRHSQHQGEESNNSSLKFLHEANDGEEHNRKTRSAPLHPQQVVTEETEANRPRFGRRHSASKEATIYSHPNANESHNNLSPRCFDSHDRDDIDQASNTFNNLNIGDWQHNPHHTKLELDEMRMNDQRKLRVVTAETEANRPRFGINHHECLNSQLTAIERVELRKLVSLSMRHSHQITEESVDSPFYNPGAEEMDEEFEEITRQGMVVHTKCN